MKTSCTLKNNFIIFSLCCFYLLLNCANNDPHSRINPWDPNGDNFSQNQAPEYLEISVTWYDFNFDNLTGNIKFSYNAYDPNEKYDTMHYTIYLGQLIDSLDSVYSGRDTFYLYQKDLILFQKLCYKILVKDLYDSSLIDSGSFFAPAGYPPHAPNNYNLSSTYDFIKISWDSISGANGYNIYRADSPDGLYSLITSIKSAPNLILTYDYNYQDTVQDYAFHYYKISSFNNYGECRTASEIARKYFSGLMPPSIKSISKGTYKDSVKISWDPVVSTKYTISYYQLYRKVSSIEKKFAYIATIPHPSSSSTIDFFDTLYIGDTCYYKVAVFDSEDRGSMLSNEKYGYFYHLPAPSSLSASKGSYHSYILLSWNSVNKAKQYYIYRALKSSDSYICIDSTVANTYKDSSMADTLEYYYKVAAVDSTGRTGARSAYSSGYLRSFSAPVNLTATDYLYKSHIVLTWEKVLGVLSYNIYRASSSSTSTYKKIVNIKALIYNDSSVSPDSTYYYKISAINKNGESSLSDSERGNVLRYPENFHLKGYLKRIKLLWDPISAASGYYIYRSITNNNYIRIDTISSSSTASYNDSVTTFQKYHYKISTFSPEDESVLSSSDSCKMVTESPDSLRAEEYQNHVRIIWNTTSGAEYYYIYRGTSSDSIPFLDSTTDTTYNDTLSSTTRYYYQVRAVNMGGVSSKSDHVKAGIFSYPENFHLKGYLNRIKLLWDSNPFASGYYIYRSSNNNDFNRIDTITSSSTASYNDSVKTFQKYYYKISSFSSKNESALSHSDSCKMVTEPPDSLRAEEYQNHVRIIWNTTSGAEYYYIYRGTSSDSIPLLDSTTDTTYSDTLSSDIRYYYQVSSVNMGGTSSKSAYIMAGIFSYPENFETKGYTNRIKLLWDSNPYASGYYIYRSTNNNDFNRIDTIASSSTASYNDSVPTFQKYYYKISSFSPNNESALSPSDSCKMVPEPPDSLRAEEYKDCVRLIWNVSSGAEYYYIYRGTSSSSTTLIDSTTDTTYNDTLSSTTRYYYQISAVNLGGISNKSNYILAGSLTAPLAPSTFNITSSPIGITLTWKQNTSGPIALKFYLYRSLTSSGPYSKIDSTADSSYYDTVITDDDYYYKVSGWNIVGEGVQTSYLSGRRTVPNTPTGITIESDMYFTHIPLAWDQSIGADGYYIHRSTSSIGTYTKIDSTTELFYNDSSALINTTYYYKISSYNVIGEGSLSNYVSGQKLTPPLPPGSVYATKGTKVDTITVNWSSCLKTDEYAVYSDTNIDFSTPVLRSTTTDTLLYDIVSSDSSFYYRIKSINNAGESLLSSVYAEGYRKPSSAPEAPENLWVTDTNGTDIPLSWSAPSTGTPHVEGYIIYRADAQVGPFQSIDTITNLFYYDIPSGTYPTYYWYQVTAYNTTGEGPASNIAKGTRRQ